MTLISSYSADHRFLVNAAAKAAGITDPVAFVPNTYDQHLLKSSTRGMLIPLDGVLLRDWRTGGRHHLPGTEFGIRLYRAENIRFARCVAGVHCQYKDE